MDDELVVTTPGACVERDGSIWIPHKTLTGLQQFALHWPGRVTFLTSPSTDRTPPSDTVEVLPNEGPFRVQVSTDRVAAVAARRPCVTLVNLAQSELPLLEHVTSPIVVVAESTHAMRVAWASIENEPAPVPLRLRLGLRRLETRYRRAIARAAGLQCNGMPALTAYRELSSNPVLFYDSRYTSDMPQRDSAGSGHPGRLNLAFSGRWLPQKGFDHAIRAFQLAADRSSVPMTLELLGDGEANMPTDERIHQIGFLDFSTDWVRHVANDVDALLIPHRQPDPSCTYLEGAGLGVPFLGYANEHARDLAARGLGSVVALDDVTALARLIELAATDTTLTHLTPQGRAFVTSHTFPHEMKVRVNHLIAVASSFQHEPVGESC